jgi:hypothetical protein
MTAKERIRKALYGARGPLCDDCLPGEAILRRRQQANAECRLWREGEVNRGRGTCALCGGVKLVNWSLAPTTRAANMSVRASGLVPATGDFQPQSTAQPLPTRKASPGTAPWPPAEAAIRCFGDYAFARVCEIQPERDRAGQVRSFTPHEHSPNSRSLPLHVYGSGPFCRFRIPSDLPLEGVYLLVVRDIVRYVGECENLSRRYNAGYGQISPRSCFIGGQSTNCKVNGLLFAAAVQHDPIDLWFHRTDNRWRVESDLIARLQPDWNGRRRT